MALSVLAFWLAVALPGVGMARSPKINKKKLQRAIVHFSRACTLEKQGAISDAVTEYGNALREDSDEPYWWMALGAALEKQGNEEDALAAYDRARQLSPDDMALGSTRKVLRTVVAGSRTAKTPATTPAGIFDVGGSVSAPRPVYQPDPRYSEKARVAKYSGTTVLEIIVDPQGSVTEVADLKPLGLGLDENAIATVRTWKFSPAMKEGEPVAARVDVEVSFRLM